MAATYVALGDSYAAGVGAGARSGPCWRARGGYPLQVAASLGLDLSWQACIFFWHLSFRRGRIGKLFKWSVNTEPQLQAAASRQGVRSG